MRDFNIIDCYDVCEDSKRIFEFIVDKWDFDLTKQEIKEFFVKNQGWQYKRFENAWKECKNFVNSI